MNAWLLLALAIVVEVIATSALKLSAGFTKPVPVAVVVVGYLSAFYLLSLIVQKLDLSVVYAIWSGVGIALIAIIGIVVFKEQMTLVRLAGFALMIVGVVLLNLSSQH